MNALRLLFVSLWMKVFVLPFKISLMEPLQDIIFFGMIFLELSVFHFYNSSVILLVYLLWYLVISTLTAVSDKIVVEFSGIQIIDYSG